MKIEGIKNELVRQGTHSGKHVLEINPVSDSLGRFEKLSPADILHEASNKMASMLLLKSNGNDPSEVEAYELLRESHSVGVGVMIDTNGKVAPQNKAGDFKEPFDWVTLRFSEKTHHKWFEIVDEIFIHVDDKGQVEKMLNLISEIAEAERLEHYLTGCPIWIECSGHGFGHREEVEREVREAIFTMATPWGGELRYRY